MLEELEIYHLIDQPRISGHDGSVTSVDEYEIIPLIQHLGWPSDKGLRQHASSMGSSSFTSSMLRFFISYLKTIHLTH